MINSKKLKYCYIVILFLILNISNCQVLAEEDGLGYAVTPSLPNTQLDPNLGYFYLITKPDEPQFIEVKVSSLQKESLSVNMFIQDGFTSVSGMLNYASEGDDGYTRDKSLVNSISELVKAENGIVEIGGFEEKLVTFKVTPPGEHYAGIKIGQLVFELDQSKEEKKAVAEVYRYAITVILSESGDDFNDGNELVLNEVKPTIKYGKRLVIANLQNPLPKTVEDLEMVGTITEKGRAKVVKQRKISDFMFAPNSNTDFEMDWGLANLKAGDYTLELTAKNNFEKFSFKKDFRITGKQAKSLNEESAFKIETPSWVKMVAILNAVVVIAISVIVVKRNRKWQNLSKKRKKQKKNLKQSRNKQLKKN